MKKIFILLFSILLISCNESFEKIDTEMINKEIANYTEIETPEQLILFYYNYPKNEGKPNLKITNRKLANQVYEITLIHDFMQDDSQKAEKVIMIAEKISFKWHVKSIKRNWKCHYGRGNTDWGTDVCD